MSYYDDDDYSVDPPLLSPTARYVLISAAILVVLWLLWRPSEGYLPCLGDCPELPTKPPVVVNPYMWPYSGASCFDDLYVMDRQVRGTSDIQPLVSLNTPDHVVLSSVDFGV